MWNVNEDAESAYVQGINQQRYHCHRITSSSFSSPMVREMESTREWKDQKLYTAMEIRHLVVPSLSSSRSLAETRATLEGEKCGHSGEIVFVSFDIRDTTNVPQSTVHYRCSGATTRCYFF